MGRRRRLRHLGALAALVLVAALVISPAAASADTAVDGVLALDGPVRLVGGEDVLITVDGTRYHDTIELAADGQVINELGMERYVAGIAEMPSRWPLEALKAQAVAARTYAWWSAERGVHEGFDICATTACQVFDGAEVVLDGGDRWAEAVAATAGEVLQQPDGDPILARYFSTSGGRTYANEDVFPATGPSPYLVAIEDPFDAVSPYHRWQVRFSREEFDEILSRGQRLAATVPVAEVARTGAVDDVQAGFEVTGLDGTVVAVGAVELRDFLSLVAPQRFPDRFPTRRADGLRPLPTTVPSSRFTVAVTDDEVVLDGRGWGHGVGMGQYGARGRAQDGADHVQILSAYYGGLAPEVSPRLPERVRVGLGARDTFTWAGDDAVAVVDAAGETIVERAIGPWQARSTGSGWELVPPEDSGRALEVTSTEPVPALTRPGAAITVETQVNKHVLLRLEVEDADGRPVVTRDLGLAEPGTHAATWRLTNEQDVPVPVGTYRLRLVGEDAAGDRAGTATHVAIEQAARPADGSDTNPFAGIGSGILTVVGAGLMFVLVLLLVPLLFRRPTRSRP
ncbi:MAG: SpoIID/LytB domain-containing protein [Nitriliruptoraceae bacterium]